MDENVNSRSVFETHAQTIIASVMLIIISWAGYSLNEQGKTQAEMVQQISFLQMQIKDLKENLKEATQSRYTRQDHMAYAADIAQTILDIRQSIAEIRTQSRTNSDEIIKLKEKTVR